MQEDVIRILCLGDSTTQGWCVDMETESYPVKLQQLLKNRIRGNEIQVINLGMASMNSSQLLNSAPNFFRAVKPQFVILMIGMNDPWNLEESSIPDFVSYPRVARAVLRLRILLFRIKLYKLFKSYQFFDIKKRLHDTYKDAPLFSDPQTKKKGINIQSEEGRAILRLLLEGNIQSLVSIAAEQRIKVILMLYHQDGYGEPNEILQDIYRKFDLPVVDLRTAFRNESGSLRSELICDDRFHPNAKGYEVIAQTIFPVIYNLIKMQAE